jgi:hypothetical protein
MGKDKLKLKPEEYEFFKDRLFAVSLIIDGILQQHPVAKIEPKIKDHISLAVDELYKAAQKVEEINKTYE